MELLTFSVSCGSKSALQFCVCEEQNVKTAVSHTRQQLDDGNDVVVIM